eukprot:m.182829 g.182829  ORF g.182829 m.182829 type:complete len:297 (-) comp14675_c2_seq3:820-1710(-)
MAGRRRTERVLGGDERDRRKQRYRASLHLHSHAQAGCELDLKSLLQLCPTGPASSSASTSVSKRKQASFLTGLRREQRLAEQQCEEKEVAKTKPTNGAVDLESADVDDEDDEGDLDSTFALSPLAVQMDSQSCRAQRKINSKSSCRGANNCHSRLEERWMDGPPAVSIDALLGTPSQETMLFLVKLAEQDGLTSAASSSVFKQPFRVRRPCGADGRRCRKNGDGDSDEDEDDDALPAVVCRYLSCAAPQAKASRHRRPNPFCGVCGSLAQYVCVYCGTRYCCLPCFEHHRDTRCAT